MIASLALVMALGGPGAPEKETVAPELLQKWVEDLAEGDADARETAACHMAARGPAAGRAVPALMKALEREVRLTAPGPRVRTGSCVVRDRELPPLTLVHGRPDPASVDRRLRRREVLERRARDPIPYALRRLHAGERAATSVLEMIRSEPGLRFVPRETASILGRLGPEAVPAFARALHDPNAQIRYLAVVALGEVDPASKSALAVLHQAVDEQSGDVQQEAAAALDTIENRKGATARAAARASR